MLANPVFFCHLNLLPASGTVDSLKYFSLGTHITMTSLAALSISLAGFFSYIQPVNVDTCQGLFLSPFSIHTLSSSNLFHSYGFKKYFMKNFNQIQDSILKPTYSSTFSMFCISTCWQHPNVTCSTDIFEESQRLRSTAYLAFYWFKAPCTFFMLLSWLCLM